MTIILFMILGLFLTLFNLDYHLIKAIEEWTSYDLSVSSYWAFWFLLGVLFEIIDSITNYRRNRDEDERNRSN